MKKLFVFIGVIVSINSNAQHWINYPVDSLNTLISHIDLLIGGGITKLQSENNSLSTYWKSVNGNMKVKAEIKGVHKPMVNEVIVSGTSPVIMQLLNEYLKTFPNVVKTDKLFVEAIEWQAVVNDNDIFDKSQRT